LVAAVRLGDLGGLDRRQRGDGDVVLCPRAPWWWGSPTTVMSAIGE
jgi:hypothetical protein